MADDYFSGLPSFVNPAYASPEQLATARAYADALTKRSGEKVNRPAGAAANVIDAITAALTRNNANAIQQQAAQSNTTDQASIIRALQNGGKVDADTLGRLTSSPLVSPEQRAMAIRLAQPEATTDVYGRPGYASPAAGIHATPIAGKNFAPGYRTPESAGSVSTTTAIPAPGYEPKPISPAPAPAAAPQPPPGAPPKLDAVSPQGGVFGGMNSSPVGWNGQPAPAIPTGGSRLDELAAKDRQLSAEKARTESGAKAEGSVIESDVKRAAAAPETLKGLGIMRNTISQLGDSMTFGPTAKMSNEARRVIANYAPGLVDEKALAGADAIEKLNLGLAGALSSQLGLNASDIYRSVASVPGNEKSKQGTLALINMMEQAARNDQYVGTTLYQNSKGNLDAYQLARADYYQHHPIVNPITGNEISIDASKAQAPAPTGGVVSVNTPEEASKLPKGTRFRAPDGSIRVVP